MNFKIKEARERAGLSQKQLADILGVAPNTFHGYESGKHDPKSKLLAEIAIACSVTVDFLLGIDESTKPAEADTGDEDARRKVLIGYYNQLNKSGKQELVDYAEGLTYMPKYKKCDSVSKKEVG